ncbi:MAG: dephospho-CoA kinase [Blastocatellia bacterium]|nr:dephospho-CoA kinase [Blastocatellia bacterium]MCS7157006.1 dephospho-CoA kinase [Blastocatellia bacterium]MCX7752207.1 dephospho-CoA kinase [Blastocatellia bacterium]MDW8167699.1 dephospho-CoA kinase [Acidobacteriota bacterium]
MMKVALTGSIAVGKSTVLALFRELGCHTMEADEIAHEVMQPCRPAYHDVVRAFGPEILAEDGTIHRGRLGAIVFRDSARREQLNRLVHPHVLEEIERRIAELERKDPSGILIVAAALVIEAGAHRRFDRTIVVYCDEEEQIARLRRREGISREEALARIRAQLPSSEKRRYADFEIDTSGPLEQTRAQVEAIYRHLRAGSSTLS